MSSGQLWAVEAEIGEVGLLCQLVVGEWIGVGSLSVEFLLLELGVFAIFRQLACHVPSEKNFIGSAKLEYGTWQSRKGHHPTSTAIPFLAEHQSIKIAFVLKPETLNLISKPILAVSFSPNRSTMSPAQENPT